MVLEREKGRRGLNCFFSSCWVLETMTSVSHFLGDMRYGTIMIHFLLFGGRGRCVRGDAGGDGSHFGMEGGSSTCVSWRKEGEMRDDRIIADGCQPAHLSILNEEGDCAGGFG